MTDPIDIAALRRDYRASELLESGVDKDPLKQFMNWFDQALKAKIPEPNAMCLSTVENNRPDSRIVLLKGVQDGRFSFYTNYHSAKGRQIEANNHVSLNFVWLELERQVRIQGVAEKLSPEANDAYFYSRPLSSQLGAIVSSQSELLTSREELEKAMLDAEQKYATEKPLRPEHWGGYAVIPESIEFWQGRSSRLHDRLRYDLTEGGWKIVRLNP
jgi:pyridoxamine 5'-phosphate oxidase